MAAWTTGAGQAVIDCELYLPREWTDDRERCRAAHVPDTVGVQANPRLAEQMIERALLDFPERRVWVAANEIYGRDGAFRVWWEWMLLQCCSVHASGWPIASANCCHMR
ncbi:transposase [Streptomyces sp. NPDC055692]|uniref:transposase n=1 Tax=Streptomyces sp. NPDC055692 TaxID=3155683 RepID=UPI00341EEFD4